MSTRERIVFLLHQEDGYPPVSREGVWARPTEAGLFQVDNIPFFTAEATLDDLVAARREGEELVFERLVRASGNSLIRIFCPADKDIDRLRREFRTLGCASEWSSDFRLIALNVPPNASLQRIQDLLHKAAAAGQLDYEEAILRQ